MIEDEQKIVIEKPEANLADALEPAELKKPAWERIPWTIVALILGGLAAFVAITICAPPAAQTLLFGANGLVCTLVGIYLRSPKDR